MKHSIFAAAALAASTVVAAPAAAITFPTLTTIYVGSGVVDDGGAANTGIATNFSCTNVSGVTANVRFLVLGVGGGVAASETATLTHGATRTASTHLEATFSTDFPLNTGFVGQGGINIESTQSGVFCNAVVTDGADAADGFTLPLVRVNPHPGTVE